MSNTIADQPLKDTYDNEIFTCECRHCLSAGKTYFKDPGAHKRSVRQYYARKRDSMLLSKAYQRHQAGVKTQKRMLERLLEAGFPVTTPQSFENPEEGDLNMMSFVTDRSIEAT
jgi:hypothetical protein